MNTFRDILTMLGQHYVLVLVACAELAAAVVLIGLIPRRRRRRTSGAVFTDTERLMLQELSVREDELCIALRRADLMPVSAVGDLEGMLGVTLRRLQENIEALLHQTASPDEAAAFWRAYRGWDGAAPLYCQLGLRDGNWVEVLVHRSRDASTDLMVFRLITEEHQREEAYQAQLLKAEKASQFKTSFLFRMSHEIRTPMNGITGMLRLAKDKLTPDHPAMQYLLRADELSDHLLSLINDILDMSHIEAGKVELEIAPFSLRAFGAKLYDMFAKTLDAKGIRYAVNYESMTADWVLGDELRIGQVVINVLDTGIGMDPEFLSRFFRPFEQEDASSTRRFGGTGLGMAISDQLVKLMAARSWWRA